MKILLFAFILLSGCAATVAAVNPCGLDSRAAAGPDQKVCVLNIDGTIYIMVQEK